MKYGFSSPIQESDTYIAIHDDEPTLIAWKSEGRVLEYGVGWRDLCRRAGIVDPMQAANITGDRAIVGTRLRMGQVLKV